MGQLALTFRGPFVFVVEPSSVSVYAPKCPGHRAGIFTANSEEPICGSFRNGGAYGSYTYTLCLKGIDNNCGPIKHQPPNDTMILDATGHTVDITKASFCINVPRPSTVYAINPAKTEVVKESPPCGTPADPGYATGLRFYYESNDLTKAAITLITPKPECENIPLLIDGLPSLPNYADVDITYADPDADDADHADAMSCFDNTMQILGLKWWLYYGQADKGGLARTGSDCQSLAVAMGL